MKAKAFVPKRTLNTTRFLYIIKGLLVGLLVGLVVSLFRLAIEHLLLAVKSFFQLTHSNPWLLLLWLPVALVICLVNGYLIKTTPHIKGSGIPQVEGQLAGDLEMQWWPVLWKKWIGGVLGIGSGLFLGREGPSIQLGAAIGQGVAETMKKRGSSRRVLIAGGAAAGLSAAFNAPIASSLFIVEEVYHNFSPLVWTNALAASVSANYVSMTIFGLKPVLLLDPSSAFPVKDYWQLILLGIVLGLLGLVYQYLTLNAGKFYRRIPGINMNYVSFIPLLLLIPIAYWYPVTLGGGNALITGLRDLPASVVFLAGIFVLRLLFSVMSYGTGLPGGIFLPILSLGAVIGACFGQGMVALGLTSSALVVDFIIYAMAGYFACIGKAPFTAILLITEMVGSLQHLMPLAVVSLIAYTVVDLLRGAPIYEAMLKVLLRSDTEYVPGDYQDRLEIPVFAGSYLQDKQVRDIPWPKNCLLISIMRGESESLPHGDTVMRCGDTLVVLTKHHVRAEVKRQISALAERKETEPIAGK